MFCGSFEAISPGTIGTHKYQFPANFTFFTGIDNGLQIGSASGNENADSKWATKDDPRVTGFGAFLRRTSLDELPQFINVLRGEMAIVGPRPLPVQLNEIYKNKVDKFFQRHAYKPGITGLAQSMGYRGEIRELHDIRKRVKLDRFYFQNWTFFFDLKIILKTIYALIRGQETAY